MFDKFGEFDSADEMNRAAAAQRKEGDNEAILAIAEENGIDREDAIDFIDGCVAAFVTPLMAAYGKLDIEAKELKPYEIMEDWLQYIKLRCAEEPEMAVAVRQRNGESRRKGNTGNGKKQRKSRKLHRYNPKHSRNRPGSPREQRHFRCRSRRRMYRRVHSQPCRWSWRIIRESYRINTSPAIMAPR